MCAPSSLSNLRMPNVEVWKQLAKIRANISTECSSKSCKFHSRSVLGRELLNEDFKTVEEVLDDRQDLNLSVPRDAAESVGCEEGS